MTAVVSALEFYDFTIFIFLAVPLGRVFFPPDLPSWMVTLQTFGIFSAGYLVRPLSGAVLANFGDLFGRRRIFCFSILLMALSTLGIGCLPTYDSVGLAAPVLLLLMRILQGVAIGTEAPGAWTFVCEHIPQRHAGLACGIVSAGLISGVLIGTMTVGALRSAFSSEDILHYAWRFPFALAGILGLVAAHLRRWAKETPVFVHLQQARMLVPELPLKVVIRSHARGIMLSILFTWILSSGVVITTIMTPLLLQAFYHYSERQSLIAVSIGITFNILGSIFAGAAVDRIGVGPFFLAGGAIFGCVTFVFYSYAGISPIHLYVLYATMGFSTSIGAMAPYAIVRFFPAHVRFTGVSFSFNLAYAFFGSLTPLGMLILLPDRPLLYAYLQLFVAALSMCLGLYVLINRNLLWNTDSQEELF